MNKKEQKQIHNVKTLLPYFASVQNWSRGKIIDVNYGCLISEGIWDATLVLFNGVHIEFTCESQDELYHKVEETVELLGLN